MNGSVIKADNLVKEFVVSEKDAGLLGSVKGLFAPRKRIKRAVDGVSFDIGHGEVVGYIGPNGAGKSTTIKMMCGILNPTSGQVLVGGLSPAKHRQRVVRDLGVVFGQRSQLYWDLRLGESFELLRRIYGVDKAVFAEKLRQLDEILGIGELSGVPVRQLSLGQRMRGDLAASMLHSPSILFLDEPTIGLDVDVKFSVRRFIKEINEKYGVTIILTTHDLDDVQALCRRIIIINDGRIVSDSPLEELIDRHSPYRLMTVDLNAEEITYSHPRAEVLKTEGPRLLLRFRKNEISAGELISDIAAKYQIKDLSLQESDIDEIIRRIYASTGK